MKVERSAGLGNAGPHISCKGILDFILRSNGKTSIVFEQGSGVIIGVFKRSPRPCGWTGVVMGDRQFWREIAAAGTTVLAVERELSVRLLTYFGGRRARD